jgi:WD40-like Beta Propeller Repeat
LLVSGPYGPKDKGGMWVFSVEGGTPRQVFAGGFSATATLSPDDSQFAFIRGGAIWVSRLSGGEPRRIISPAPGYHFGNTLAWSPDGSRIAFAQKTLGESTLITYDRRTASTAVILSDPKVSGFCWSRDGLMIFARQEDEPNQGSANLWALAVDNDTGRARGKPRRLTDWGGFLFDEISVNARGTRISVVRKRFRSSIYVGKLPAGGNGIAPERFTPKRFTFDAWINVATGWTHDSRSVLFTSDRTGSLDIFQQNPDAHAPTAMVAGEGARRAARPSADGAWILYLTGPATRLETNAGIGRLMRIARAGSSPELVLPVRGYPRPSQLAWAEVSPGEGVMPHPGFRCPSSPGSPCVLSERVNNEVIFTAFDPVKGRKQELARVPESSVSRFWDLSPDGRWIATYRVGGISLISLAGEAPRDIQIEHWQPVTAAWAPDGKSLFATAWASKNPPVLRVFMDGAVRVLHQGLFHTGGPVASPDGRYLAFTEDAMESNVWVVEQFR